MNIPLSLALTSRTRDVNRSTNVDMRLPLSRHDWATNGDFFIPDSFSCRPITPADTMQAQLAY